MKSISKKLIILSFILAALSSIAVFSYLKSLKTLKAKESSTTILVAAETISERTIITKKMLKEIKVPENSIFTGTIKDQSKVIGKYTKYTILKDEWFKEDKLISSNGNDLSSNIEENHRAMSINVTGDSGVSYLLKSGDLVDIIVYLPEKKEGQEIVRPDTAKLLLQKIKVLAIDRQISTNEKQADPKEKMPANFLVTLSIPTEDMEKVVLAEDIGRLKLVLRPLDNENNSETQGATWQEIIGDTSSMDDKKNENTSDKFVSYTIKPGDTLRKISKNFYGNSEKYTVIKELNKINDENEIISGEQIKIPAN